MTRALLPALLLASGCGFEDIVDDRMGTIDADLAEIHDRLEDLEAENVALRDRLAAVEIGSGASGWIREPETWLVPGDYANLQAALVAAADVRIWPSGRLTIQLEPGDHALVGPITLAHPDGQRIDIIGDLEGTATTTLQCGGAGCFDLSTGGSLGALAGLDLSGPGSGVAVEVGSNGRITLGPGLRISKFETGLSASTGGVIRGEGVILDSNRVGVMAESGGIIDLLEGSVRNSTLVGLAAEPGGLVVAYDVDVAGGTGGLSARGGQIWAPLASVSDQRRVAVSAAEGGRVLGARTRAAANGIAYEAVDGGHLVMDNATATGNVVDVSLDNGSSASMPGFTGSNAPGTVEVRYRSTWFSAGTMPGAGVVVSEHDGKFYAH